MLRDVIDLTNHIAVAGNLSTLLININSSKLINLFTICLNIFVVTCNYVMQYK
jgi:hypothetical protein